MTQHKNNKSKMTRRKMLAATGLAMAAAMPLGRAQTFAAANALKERKFALNTGTLLGYNLSIEEEIDVTAKAGYGGIEIWLMRLEKYLEEGKSLADLKKRIDDSGLTVEGAIGFANWIVDDDAARARGLEQMKRDMGRLAQIGCRCIAAPASGATNKRIDDLEACGERYRVILEIGQQEGVTPILEQWGPSQTLRLLSDVAAIAVAAKHPNASVLLDAYHLYKGGNDYISLKQLNGRAMRVFHLNDYPADPPRETIADKDRVFPGDGVCPFDVLLPTLDEIGFEGVFSLELFNRGYQEKYKPIELAKIGLEKMQAIFA